MISSAAATAPGSPSTVKTRAGRWMRAKSGCSAGSSLTDAAPPPRPRALAAALAAEAAGVSVHERTSAPVSAHRSRTLEPAGPMTKPAASSETARRAPPVGVAAAARMPWEAASTGATPSPGRRGPEGAGRLSLAAAGKVSLLLLSSLLGPGDAESDDEEESCDGEAARCSRASSWGNGGGGRGEGVIALFAAVASGGEKKGVVGAGVEVIPPAARAALLPGKAAAARAAAAENAAACGSSCPAAAVFIAAPPPPPPPPSSSSSPAKRGLFPSEPETKPNSSRAEEKERAAAGWGRCWCWWCWCWSWCC